MYDLNAKYLYDLNAKVHRLVSTVNFLREILEL